MLFGWIYKVGRRSKGGYSGPALASLVLVHLYKYSNVGQGDRIYSKAYQRNITKAY